jgi:hypothetical protein
MLVLMSAVHPRIPVVYLYRAALAVLALGPAFPAAAQWTVTNLTPPTANGAFVNNGFGMKQAGYVVQSGQYRASLWNASASLRTDLAPTGANYSEVFGLSDSQQVGYALLNNQYRPGLWTGTAASWIDLTPTGATEGYATSVSSNQQVGYVFSSGRYRASLWGGTAASWLDLSPPGSLESYALATSAGQQGGYAYVVDRYRAGFWTGSAASWTELAPPAASDSAVMAVDGGQQAGYVYSDGKTRASLWNGTAASWIDLTPTGATYSCAWAVYGGQQAGDAIIASTTRAGVWGGTAFSWVDLHSTLPPDFTASYARSIWSDEATTYVSGYGVNSATRRTEALLWTRPSPATCRAVWTNITGTGPGPRFGAAMVDDPARSNLILFGGGAGAIEPDDVSPDTWTFNGTTWTRAATTGPTPRDLPAMVYDSVRQKVVLFGGRTNSVGAGTETFLSDTWEWDGTAWTQRTTAHAPSPRFRAAAAFDAQRCVMVLYGGSSNIPNGPPIPSGELWEYNGVDWTLRTIAGTTPGPRFGSAAAFDASRGVTVLWGGLTDSTIYNDTWEFDGTTWTRRATALAGLFGTQGVMSYDSMRHRVLLTEGDLTSLWSWDGVAWMALTPNPGPAARSFPAMAYDPRRDALVVMGGVNWGVSTFADTVALPCPSSPWSLATQPAPTKACPGGTASFSVGIAGTNPGPYTFQWQIETAPGVWATLGNDPLPLPCGGSAYVHTTSSGSPNATIGVQPCPGNPLASQTFYIRTLVSTPCCTTPSVRTAYSICPADFDCNGSLAVADIFAFLNAWFAGSPAADLDGTPGLQVNDIFAFLNIWFAGC